MILILSMEKLAMNPAKETVRYSYYGLYGENQGEFVERQGLIS